MKADRVVIKKYGNRRLYDTSTSKYINLEDIAVLIRNGTDVQIVDAQTGADLTGGTLAQIIAESAKDKPIGLPLELLRQLIVTTDHAGQEFISWYLKSALDTYQQVQSSLKDRLSQVGAAAFSPLQTMSNLLERRDGDQTAELRAKLASLEAQLAQLQAGKKATVKSKMTKGRPPSSGRREASNAKRAKGTNIRKKT